MRRRLVLLPLLFAAGCAAPPYTADYNIGMVKTALLEEAVDLLAGQGVHAQKGAEYGGHTGLRVMPEQSYWATRVLLQWRRTQEPGAFLTREEFEMGVENP
jgi:hypothetical protein